MTGVDYERREVLVDITSRQGARPHLRMSIFDRASPGVPNAKPKGTIEVTQVGESSSTARIIKTNSPIASIRVGDILYGLGGSPDSPTRFALVGMMDLNRDDKDDRDELKRLIQQAGGIIEFDLPPSDVGQETGRLLPRIDWYVIDDQTRPQPQFAKRMGEVIKEARLNGIRPMPIGRLPAFLGHGMNQPVVRQTLSGGQRWHPMDGGKRRTRRHQVRLRVRRKADQGKGQIHDQGFPTSSRERRTIESGWERSMGRSLDPSEMARRMYSAACPSSSSRTARARSETGVFP